MHQKIRRARVSACIALLAGCASPSPQNNAPTQVQVNFNLPVQCQLCNHKSIERGAISGMPQRIGFFYSVNPDCSSGGLVNTQLKTPPAHGSVAFVEADGYSSFAPNSPSFQCNKQKSPGIEVMYTSAKDFVGTDQFTVVGIGPKGAYMETDYTVKVLATVSP
jgi:hypothetical protein